MYTFEDESLRTHLLEGKKNSNNGWWILCMILICTYLILKHPGFYSSLESQLGVHPDVKIGDIWRIEIPVGEVFPGAIIPAPPNYAQISNPWITLQFEGQYASVPLEGTIEGFDYAQIKSKPMQGFQKDGFVVQIQHSGTLRPENFVLKVNKKWHPVTGELDPMYNAEINEIYVDYTIQVALSYLSFVYSNKRSYTKWSGPSHNLGNNGGKFAYSQPFLVKVISGNMWTLGLMDHKFGNFAKMGNNIPEGPLERAGDFAQWVERHTSKERFPSEALQVRDWQGFWEDRSTRTLYMSDGSLWLKELRQEPTDKVAELLKCIDACLREIHKILKQKGIKSNIPAHSGSSASSLSPSIASGPPDVSSLASSPHHSVASLTVNSPVARPHVNDLPLDIEEAGSPLNPQQNPMEIQSPERGESPPKRNCKDCVII